MTCWEHKRNYTKKDDKIFKRLENYFRYLDANKLDQYYEERQKRKEKKKQHE